MSFMMMVHPDQIYSKCNYSFTYFRPFIKIPLYAYGFDDRIFKQMLNTSNEILFDLEYFYNGRKKGIVTPNKEKGNVFLQCCTEIIKVIILCNANEVLFKEIKLDLKDICW